MGERGLERSNFNKVAVKFLTVISQKTAMPKDLTQTLRSLKDILSTEMLFVVR